MGDCIPLLIIRFGALIVDRLPASYNYHPQAMNHTTRRFPRDLEQAFGAHTSRTIVETRPTLGWRLREFITVYRAYRLGNGRRYATWIAWQIAFKGCPF